MTLLELLHPVLARSVTYDLAAGTVVSLDQAASASARADPEAQQIALRHPVSLTDRVPSSSPWYRYGRVWSALYAWRCGDVDRALHALRRIGMERGGYDPELGQQLLASIERSLCAD